jgi:hypothetical protein
LIQTCPASGRFAAPITIAGESFTRAGTGSGGIAVKPASKPRTGIDGGSEMPALRFHEGVTDHLFDIRREAEYNARHLRS